MYANIRPKMIAKIMGLIIRKARTNNNPIRLSVVTLVTNLSSMFLLGFFCL